MKATVQPRVVCRNVPKHYDDGLFSVNIQPSSLDSIDSRPDGRDLRWCRSRTGSRTSCCACRSRTRNVLGRPSDAADVGTYHDMVSIIGIACKT